MPRAIIRDRRAGGVQKGSPPLPASAPFSLPPLRLRRATVWPLVGGPPGWILTKPIDRRCPSFFLGGVGWGTGWGGERGGSLTGTSVRLN